MGPEAGHRPRAPLRLHGGAGGVAVVDDGHVVPRRILLAEPGAKRGARSARRLHRAVGGIDRGGAELVRLKGDVHGSGLLDHDARAHRGDGAAGAFHRKVRSLP